MRNYFWNFLKVALLAAILLFLGGCVWLRMLEVKNQLASFDEYFSVRIEQGFNLYFKEPVLYADDLVTLSKLNPSQISRRGDVRVWEYIFEKEPVKEVSGESSANLIISMMIDESDKVAALRFSPVFLDLMPARFLEHSLRALGSGKVNRGKRRLKVDVERLAKADVVPPSKTCLLEVLGAPYKQEQTEESLKMVYRFKLQSKEKFDDPERAVSIVELKFDNGSRLLSRFKGKFAGLKLSVDYEKIFEGRFARQLNALEGKGRETC